jgi:hypothetical protein
LTTGLSAPPISSDPFPCPDVQSGLAGDVAFHDQFSNQLQFRLRGMRTHVGGFLELLVIRLVYSL